MEVRMSSTSESFLALLKAGKIDEARDLIEREKVKAKNSPNAVLIKKDGTAKFTHKGKEVLPDSDGGWYFKNKSPNNKKKSRNT